MTENCAMCTILDPMVSKSGAVGKPQPKVEVRIDEATGEICTRSPYLMREYYKSPEKTAEVLRDGWLHTGDQGYIDEDGDLIITGRVKDTFKTAKGEYIVPGPIEWSLAANNDIEQICLVGLGCVQPLALVNLSETGKAKAKEQLIAELESQLSVVNDNLPNYEKVSTIIITNEDWRVENDLLTPTLKVKRGKMNQKFQDNYSAWESMPDKVIFEQ